MKIENNQIRIRDLGKKCFAFEMLCDAYSYDAHNKKIWDSRWKKPSAESKSVKN